MTTIGVTGHRPNRLHIGTVRVQSALRKVLAALQGAAQSAGKPQQMIAVSSLAEGSDRLFAEAALDLGFELRVVLPFKSADYETTFGDAGTTPVYGRQLTLAAEVTELPGILADDTAAYEAVGRTMVEASDIMVAVWDGKPAAGRGGTPEIIEYAVQNGRPVIWINAAQDCEPVLLERREKSKPAALPEIVAKASPLTPQDLHRLVKGPSRTQRQ